MNLNDMVFVILTEHGKRILNNDRISYNPVSGKRTIHYDEDGVLKMQLWCLIEIFGEHIGLGMEDVFKNSEIYNL